jgi:S-DNA-T family DNA segregation ATPase FtsK/SpoIIIE
VPGVRAWAEALEDGPGVVVADDLTALPDPVADLLAGLCRPGRPLVLVGAGTPADLAATFRGPAAALRRSRTGLLLRPGPGDADVLGVRLPRMPVADRPGSGWLVLGGVAQRVQVARRR